MDPKKMLSKEISNKVRGQISEEIVSETVNQFFKQGNAFILLELINLRSEFKSLKNELQHKTENKHNSLHKLLVP
jgi:hypothetical protein